MAARAALVSPGDAVAARRRRGATFVAAVRRALAAIGAFVRPRVGFLLQFSAACWGVLSEGVRPSTWRRTVRAEFASTLRQAAGGGLPSTLFTASLAGIGMVSQLLYWLGLAGLGQLTGSLLVTVLLREVAPVLVGVILLGRSGMLAVAELGIRSRSGQIRTLAADGIDPFALLVVPRALAFAVASFTLGVAFALFSLVAGYVVSASLGDAYGSWWSFLFHVLGAMSARDYVVIPAKFVLIGFGVGVCSCLSGLASEAGAPVSVLLPRGFARGMLTVMAIDIAFTVLGA